MTHGSLKNCITVIQFVGTSTTEEGDLQSDLHKVSMTSTALLQKITFNHNILKII